MTFGEIKEKLGVSKNQLHSIVNIRLAKHVGPGNKRSYSTSDLTLLSQYFEAKKQYDLALSQLDKEFGRK